MADMELKDIVRIRLDQLKLSPIEVATRHGVERTFVRDILAGRKKSVRADKMPLLAEVLQLDLSALSRGELLPVEEASPEFIEPEDDNLPKKHFIPLMGFIGAGGEIMPDFEQVPPEGLDQLELPFPLPEGLIAFQIKGDSMLPFYKDGHVVVVWEDQKKPLELFYGEEAAVKTTLGRRFLKTIERGFNGVNLRSFNAPPIEDVFLEWIGEIFAVLPKSSLKHVAKAGGIQGRLNLA